MICWMNSCAFSLTIPSSVSHIGLLDAPRGPAISSLFTHPLILARQKNPNDSEGRTIPVTADRGPAAYPLGLAPAPEDTMPVSRNLSSVTTSSYTYHLLHLATRYRRA